MWKKQFQTTKNEQKIERMKDTDVTTNMIKSTDNLIVMEEEGNVH